VSNQAGFVSDAQIEWAYNESRTNAAQPMFADLDGPTRAHLILMARMVANEGVRNAVEATAIQSGAKRTLPGFWPPRVY
jgi:hypothetical protein